MDNGIASVAKAYKINFVKCYLTLLKERSKCLVSFGYDDDGLEARGKKPPRDLKHSQLGAANPFVVEYVKDSVQLILRSQGSVSAVASECRSRRTMDKSRCT